MVMVYEPKEHGFYGGTVAGPVFRGIADQFHMTIKDLLEPYNSEEKPMLASYQKPSFDIGYKKDFEEILSYVELEYNAKSNGSWTVLNPNETSLSMDRKKIKKGDVPNVKGMGLRDAMYILENLGLDVKASGYGKVMSQSIEPGVKIKGQTIELTLN
jgi:cell division protein FtsI (penicillin-binding protein 3)